MGAAGPSPFLRPPPLTTSKISPGFFGQSLTGAHLDTPTIAEVAPLPARHERGEGWGEGLFPSNCRALLKSPLPDPLPTSPSWGEGIDRGLGGCIKMRCASESLAAL